MEIVLFIKIFILFFGFIVGLGAVTVIDLHGLFARKSNYWTLATTRTHKITKPMIWIGILFVLIGGIWHYSDTFLIIHLILSSMLIINGIFLSFVISPFLLKREREGTESELLSKEIQNKIIISFAISIIGWWTSVIIFILNLV